MSAGYVSPLRQVSWDKLVTLIGKEAEETDGWIFVNENLSHAVYIYFFATFHELTNVKMFRETHHFFHKSSDSSGKATQSHQQSLIFI